MIYNWKPVWMLEHFTCILHQTMERVKSGVKQKVYFKLTLVSNKLEYFNFWFYIFKIQRNFKIQRIIKILIIYNLHGFFSRFYFLHWYIFTYLIPLNSFLYKTVNKSTCSWCVHEGRKQNRHITGVAVVLNGNYC